MLKYHKLQQELRRTTNCNIDFSLYIYYLKKTGD